MELFLLVTFFFWKNRTHNNYTTSTNEKMQSNLRFKIFAMNENVLKCQALKASINFSILELNFKISKYSFEFTEYSMEIWMSFFFNSESAIVELIFFCFGLNIFICWFLLFFLSTSNIPQIEDGIFGNVFTVFRPLDSLKQTIVDGNTESSSFGYIHFIFSHIECGYRREECRWRCWLYVNVSL